MRRIILILILLLVMTIALSGCNQEDVEGIYPPMISIENDIYMMSQTERASSTLFLEHKKVAEIQKIVSMAEPMVKGENYYISNGLPMGTEIYSNSEGNKIIYAKHDGKYIKYELLEN